MKELFHAFGPDEVFGVDEVLGIEVEAIPCQPGIDAQSAKGELDAESCNSLSEFPDAQIEYGDAGNVYVANSLTGALAAPANAVDAVASSSGVSPPDSDHCRASRSRRGSSSGTGAGAGTGTGVTGGSQQPLEFGEQLRRSLAAAGSTPSNGPSSASTSAHESSPSPWLLNFTARSSGAGIGSRNDMWSPGGGGSRAQSRANSRTNSRANSRSLECPAPALQG